MVQLHRVLKASPALVYKAFLDGDALCKWLPPHGYTGHMHHIDARVGGGFRMSFTHFARGESHTFGGEYQELVPDTLIRYSNQFDNPDLPGVMQTTVTLKPVFCGTELHVRQEGIPEAIPSAACYLGWQESLLLLASLVEAKLPE